jgi:hypothetical protein
MTDRTTPKQSISWTAIVGAASFLALAMVSGYIAIGVPPVVIVGGSGLVGFVLWLWSYRRGPIDPAVILPPFLITTACLEIHMIEEYLTGFGPAMSRLFDISWTERGFLLVFAFIGPIIYSLTALGLYRRSPLAGFVAWFIFIGPGVAEFTHFIFPFVEPAIRPGDPNMITQAVGNGRLVENMRNYFIGTTGNYYFPGLYSAILPMIPGMFGIYTVIRERRRESMTETCCS